MAYDQVISHRGILSPKGKHSFYWLLAISFIGLTGCITLIAVQYPYLSDSQIDEPNREVSACISSPFCIPALLFLLLFCISGLAYACFFVGSHMFMSSSSETFEKHLQAVQLPPDEIQSKHGNKRTDERVRQKYLRLLKKADAALGKNNLKKAEYIYDSVMHAYVYFSYDQKLLLHDEINVFYKRLHLAIESSHKVQRDLDAKSKQARTIEGHDDLLPSIDTVKEKSKNQFLKEKSRKFVKCWKLMTKAKGLVPDNAKRAKSYYQLSWKLYLDLNYYEKKEVYEDLKKLYRVLSQKKTQ